MISGKRQVQTPSMFFGFTVLVKEPSLPFPSPLLTLSKDTAATLSRGSTQVGSRKAQLCLALRWVSWSALAEFSEDN